MGNQTSQSNTISNFEPERYEGTWWEIARYPNFFQAACVRSQACYHWNPQNQTMKVCNKCSTKSDKPIKIVGQATIPDPKYPGQLEVVFPASQIMPGSTGQYWIHWTDYDNYAIVGNGDRSQLWILSRNEYMSKTNYELMLWAVKGLGYNPNKLIISGGAVKTGRNTKVHKEEHLVKENIEHYYDNNQVSDDTDDSKFWSDTENYSKYPGGYKNKTDYASAFSKN